MNGQMDMWMFPQLLVIKKWEVAGGNIRLSREIVVAKQHNIFVMELFTKMRLLSFLM